MTTEEGVSKAVAMKRFKQARDQGARYLLAQLHDDGRFGDSQRGLWDYYKVPAALQVAGYSAAAGRLCHWIRRKGLLPNGDFGPRPAAADPALDYGYSYFNTWVILGAQRLGQFDLAHRGMDFLIESWDAESGGFYSHPTRRDAHTKQDLWVVAGAGIAATYTARMEQALGVGRWMRRLMDLQPDYPNYLYSTYSRAHGLFTDPDLDPDPGDGPIRYVMHKDAQEDQFFFHPGIAGGFLTRLYKASGDDHWLDLAVEYMRFAEGAGDFLFGLPRSGKVGWAAAELYTLTGETKYRDMAIRVGDMLIDLQREDGCWDSMFDKVPSNDITAELTYWLDEIHQAVGEE